MDEILGTLSEITENNLTFREKLNELIDIFNIVTLSVLIKQHDINTLCLNYSLHY